MQIIFKSNLEQLIDVASLLSLYVETAQSSFTSLAPYPA